MDDEINDNEMKKMIRAIGIETQSNRVLPLECKNEWMNETGGYMVLSLRELWRILKALN